jgi:hypothetical protein
MRRADHLESLAFDSPRSKTEKRHIGSFSAASKMIHDCIEFDVLFCVQIFHTLGLALS